VVAEVGRLVKVVGVGEICSTRELVDVVFAKVHPGRPVHGIVAVTCGSPEN
jgi:hypothetical protein